MSDLQGRPSAAPALAGHSTPRADAPLDGSVGLPSTDAAPPPPSPSPAPPGLLGTTARRRLAVVAAAALPMAISVSGSEVALPLWATTELGLSAGEWAQLRSYRFWGVLVGVGLFGPVSDRLGQRFSACLTMALTGVILLAWTVPDRRLLWVLMPLFGALMSTAFVNFNVLTQRVSDARQGLANAVYRGIAQSAAIIAPVLTTTAAAAWGGYRPTFLVMAALLVLSAMVMSRYPEEHVAKPFTSWRSEWRGVVDNLSVGFSNKPLMRYIWITSLWLSVVSVPSSFVAIRFTQELGCSEQWFGWATAIASAAALAPMLWGAVMLDRGRLKTPLLACMTLGAAACIVLGCTDSVPLAAAAYVLWAGCFYFASTPLFMGLSRHAGEQQGSAFSVQKMANAGGFALIVLFSGWLEAPLGIRGVILLFGIATLFTAALALTLPEPPRLARRIGQPATPAA